MESHIPQAKNSSWIELNRCAFLNNISVIRGLIGPDVLFGCILKGNAYGHGFTEFLPLIYEAHVDIAFVVNPNDAYYIRQYEAQNRKPQKRVVVIGAITSEEILACARQDIEVTLGEEHFNDQTYIEDLKNYKINSLNNFTPLKVHLHIDTGFGREGILSKKLETQLSDFKENLDVIFVQGVMSHFADVLDQEYSERQVKEFDSAFDIIMNQLDVSYRPEKHIANSTATLLSSKYHYDIVRIGIACYGYWTPHAAQFCGKEMISKIGYLQPVLSWKTQSQAVRNIPPDSYIGYDLTYKTTKMTKVALLPLGYYDGYPRVLSNIGYVLINGQECKILGRVMMNYCVVDITGIVGDNVNSVEAILIGESLNKKITAEALAESANTIEREVLTSLGHHIDRNVV